MTQGADTYASKKAGPSISGRLFRRRASSGQVKALRYLLLAPAVVLTVLIVFVPLLMALGESVGFDDGWSLEAFRTVLTQSPYPIVLKNTFVIAGIVTFFALLLAAPAAAFIARQSSRTSGVLLALIVASLWISVLVKMFAWQVVLGRLGPLNDLLRFIGLTDAPISMLYTRGAVVISMVHFMIPHACILLVAAMRRVDWEIIIAASTLGAKAGLIFREAYWPQIRLSFIMTALIVFVLSSAFFVAPALLGGPGETMIGMQMKSDLSTRYDSGLPAATGILLTLSVILVSGIAVLMTGGSFRKATRELAK